MHFIFYPAEQTWPERFLEDNLRQLADVIVNDASLFQLSSSTIATTLCRGKERNFDKMQASIYFGVGMIFLDWIIWRHRGKIWGIFILEMQDMM